MTIIWRLFSIVFPSHIVFRKSFSTYRGSSSDSILHYMNVLFWSKEALLFCFSLGWMKWAIIMHKASLDSCALSLVEILEQTKAITINPFFLEHNGHIKCGARTPFQGPGGSWLFSPETGDTETLKKSPGTAERMASLNWCDELICWLLSKHSSFT